VPNDQTCSIILDANGLSSASWIGVLQWEGVNFSESAEDVHFSIEGDDEVPVLRATLQTEDGDSVEADINLSEHVVNDNGQFVYQ